MTSSGTSALDTFPKLLLEHARVRPDRPANREKDYGIWQSWSWAEVAAEVEAFACGLAAMGVRRGDKLAIIGDNRPRLSWAIAAIQALGGVPVPIYQDSIAEEMAFVLDHAEVRFAVAEDQEQIDKILAVKEKLPLLETVIFPNPRGMRHYDQPFLNDYARVQQRGREFARHHPGFFRAEVEKGRGSDIAIILYTSGTTGRPKGVVLSFDNIITMAQNAIAFESLTDREEVLAYLPMAWIGEHILSYAQAYCAGFCASCPESQATVIADLRELGPTYFFAPPRIFENILTQVMIRMEDAGSIKRRLFDYFIGVAKRVGPAILDRHRVPLADRMLYWLGHVLVYGPLKNTLGFSRIRVAYTAGEAIGPDLFTFYRALGINLKQVYGMTESSVFLCIQKDGEVNPDTVGAPIKDIELRIAEDGEVLFRSPGAFQCYYRNPEATAEAKEPDGWVHTGNSGFFDADGQLKILDRARDVGRLQSGALFAPKFLENKLKFFPCIKEAVAFGDGRPFVAAVINIDLEAVGDWAERRNLAYGSYQELAADPAVYDLVQGCIKRVNADLSTETALAASQIRRFLILPKELDADDGELTRTRKVRRRIVAERYRPLVDALYSGRPTALIETDITFEDGRKGSLRAELAIRDAATTLPPPELLALKEGELNAERIGEAILSANRIRLAFGGITALNDISLEVRRHEILAIIGPNGAGKTSMLNVINGFYHPQAGTITWKGETRRHMRPYLAAAQGIARTFQNVALFKGMTTLDNIMTGRLLRMRRNFLWQAIHVGPAEREELEHRVYAERIIDFLEIEAIRKTPVGRLPYGLQKRVELGRALAMEPELLLLDEPMAGMNVEEKEDMCRFILDVNDEFGTAIALIEHDMGVVMDISDRVVVLDYGRKIADGPPDEVRANPEVIAAYLGEQL